LVIFAHFHHLHHFQILPSPHCQSSKSSNHQIHLLTPASLVLSSAQPSPNKKRATTAADEKTAGEIKLMEAAMQKTSAKKRKA